MHPVTDEVDRALARLDRDEIRATYQGQNEFVHVPSCFPASLVGDLVADVERVRPAIHRNYIFRAVGGL